MDKLPNLTMPRKRPGVISCLLVDSRGRFMALRGLANEQITLSDDAT